MLEPYAGLNIEGRLPSESGLGQSCPCYAGIVEQSLERAIVREHAVSRGAPPGNSVFTVHVAQCFTIQSRVLGPVKRVRDTRRLQGFRKQPLEAGRGLLVV